jgi:hypothetical protein
MSPVSRDCTNRVCFSGVLSSRMPRGCAVWSNVIGGTGAVEMFGSASEDICDEKFNFKLSVGYYGERHY